MLRRGALGLLLLCACDDATPAADAASAGSSPAPEPDAPAAKPEVAATPVVAATEPPRPHGFALVRPGATVFLGRLPAEGAPTSVTLPNEGAGFVVAAVAREGDMISIETPVGDVPSCASLLWPLSAFRMQLHVAASDLVTVTTRRVAVEFGDGTRAELLAGVPVRRDAAGWIAQLDKHAMTVKLPDDATGPFYDPGDRSFGDAEPQPIAAGEQPLVYDRTHELLDTELEQTGFDPRLVAAFGRRDDAGRTLADVRMRCASVRAILPSARVAPPTPSESGILALSAMSEAGGLLAVMSGPSALSWQVRRGATIWSRAGAVVGLVEGDHLFTTKPEVVDARRCFATDLGGGSSLSLCFDASAVEEVPGASEDELAGLGGLGLAGAGGFGTGAGTIGLGSGAGGTTRLGTGSSGPGAIGTKKRPSGSIATGSTAVVGSLDKDIIRRVVRSHINEVKYCYEVGLRKDPTLSGKVTISFTIGASGSVSASSVADDTLGDASVGTCAAKAVKRWKFPAPKGGGVVVVKYPFVLNP